MNLNELVLTSYPNRRKLPLPLGTITRLNIALPTDLLPHPDFDPQPTNFPSLASLRLYLLTELFLRLLTRFNTPYLFTDQPTAADIYLATLTSLQPAGFNGIWLAVNTPPELPAGTFNLPAARYLILSTPTLNPLNWNDTTRNELEAAIIRLQNYARQLQATPLPSQPTLSPAADQVRQSFYNQLADGLNVALAMAVMWQMLQGDLPDHEKLALLTDFTSVLGLAESVGLGKSLTVGLPATPQDMPKQPLITDFAKAPPRPQPRPEITRDQDKVDRNAASNVNKNNRNQPEGANSTGFKRISQNRELRSNLEKPDRLDFSVSLVSGVRPAETIATLENIALCLPRTNLKIEILAVDIETTPLNANRLRHLASSFGNLKIIHTRPGFGEAAARNATFTQAQGKYVVLAYPGMRFKFGFFEALASFLEKQANTTQNTLYGSSPVALNRAGSLVTGFSAVGNAGDKFEALDIGLLCLSRQLISRAGLMDEQFRHPHALTLDYSFTLKNNGAELAVLPDLSAYFSANPQELEYYDAGGKTTGGGEGERQREKNWRLFLQTWFPVT